LEELDARVLPTAGPQATGVAAVMAPAVTARVSALVNNILATDHIPGMAVAITYDGQVILDQGYGVQGDAAKTPVQSGTTSALGSVTKSISAIATLQIVEDPSPIDSSLNSGDTSLNLDDPIKDSIPVNTPISLPSLSQGETFTLPEPWADVTPRELLNMSSGSRNGGEFTP
jgi:CubicO group peptidase (beta-lactamase class C family)